MAIAFTVVGTHSLGDVKLVHGTFTSAAGDQSATLSATTHGCNYIVFHQIESNDLGAQKPSVSKSSGTITLTFDGTLGSSGTWAVIGR